MSKPITVIGRTHCSVCDTDKSWTFTVDRATKGENIDNVIKNAIIQQNEQVVDVNHLDHLDRLFKTTKVFKG